MPVPREGNAKGACRSHLLIVVPTTTRVPGTGVDGHATGVDGHEPAVAVTYFHDYMQVPLMWPMPAVTVT